MTIIETMKATTTKTTSKTTTTSRTLMTMALALATLSCTTKTASASGCASVCLSEELAALKATLKEMQHSIYANQFFIQRNWKAVSEAPIDYFCPKERPKSCYMFVEQKKNWLEAQQYCMGKRGHLLNIETWEENLFIKGQLNGMTNGKRAWWTGGADDGVPGQWKWKMPAGEDEALTYHDWNDKQPNNDRGRQTVIELTGAGHRWNDDYDKTRQNFICEFEKAVKKAP